MKVTVPVGVPVPPLLPTAAEKVTDMPSSEGLGLELNVVVLAPGLTMRVKL
jgi:hypothetical protein